VKLIVTEPAAEYLRKHDSRVYVWAKRVRCCGGGQILDAALEPPAGRDFDAVAHSAGIDLYLPAHLGRLPDELHLDLQRFPQRIRAYWNGCAWVV